MSKPVVDINTTYLSTCALFDDGTAQCWGINTAGQLGIGNTNNIGDDELPSSSEILIFDEPIVKIAVGWSHTCALFQSQRMRCWGEGGHDHLGYDRTWLAQTFGDYRIGDNESPAVLPFVDAGGSIVDIGLGNEHSCALYDDKRVKCWGWPGPLGLGTTTIHPEELKFIPYVTLHGDVKSLRVGWGHNCVLYFDDTFTCWGENSSGELGRGNTNYLGDNELVTSLPPLSFGEPIGDIYTGSSVSCASNNLGQLRCWGLGTRGVLGYDNRLSLGDDELVVNLPYINLGGSIDIGSSSTEPSFAGATVSPDVRSNCAIVDNGKVKCWGANDFGQLGLGNSTNISWGTLDSINIEDAPYLPFDQKVIKLTSGSAFHCALLENQKVKCWGRNIYGSLGSGSLDNLGTNEDVSSIAYIPLSKPVRDIDTKWLHTCALFNDGTAQCWGWNQFGQLGIGSSNNIGDDELPSPSNIIVFDEPILKIGTGWSHTCALFESQRMKCWGWGANDHLGYNRVWLQQNTVGNNAVIGVNESPATFPYVDAGGNIVDIEIGAEHSCAIFDNKKVKCWGHNYGKLGLGTTGFYPQELKDVPFVPLHGDVKSLSVGGNHNCALYFDNTFTCWGQNDYGELGNGNLNVIGDDEFPSSVPVLTSNEIIESVNTGPNISCLKTNTGLLKCWGRGGFGALGQNSRISLGDNESIDSIPYINLNSIVDPNSNFSLISSLASFEYNPQSGAIPLQVEFTAQTDPNIFSYEWSFGDGVSVELYDPNASHIYNEVGVFTVHLKVKNSSGLTLGEMDRLVNVTDPIIKPFARFSIPSDDGVIPLSMQLDASNSFDLAGTIVEYHWLFGDGTSLITSNPIASHLYNNVGVFSISLQVKNDQGAVSDFYYDSVVALSINQAPVADFACSAGEGSISCDASTSLDYDGLINGYRWSWGDGQYSEGLTSTHNYGEPNLGNYPIVLEVVDNKGEVTSISKNYSVDQSNPLLNVELADGQRFNQNLVSIPAHITDSSVSSLVVTVNGVQSYNAEGFEHLVPLSLSEGLNLIEFEAFDSNLNSSGKQLFSNIHLDTTLPILSISTPVENSRLNAFVFPVSATSSKPLSKVLVNGFEVTLSQDQQSFDTVVASSAEGPFQTTIEATDLYGNVKTTILTNEIFLPIFNPALITTIPDPDQPGVVKVIGAPSAMRLNNHEFLADGGIFNSKYATSNADGSFEASLLYFDEVKLTAINPITNTTENIFVKHLVDTTLLGQVLDVNGLPLMGVTVSITSSGQSAITDGNGNFEIASPVTGDQTILVDATTLNPSQLLGRSFSKLSVLVTLGMTQRNILGKPIYLTPTLLDGSETIISQADGGIVASEHALGVALTIPANTVIFPDNSTEKAMNIMEIPADRSSVEVPAMAVPNTVYALEPSGVTFTEPIEVTLPNKDELPAGVEVILFSKNSKTGYWEPDGVAVVDENGTTMTTKAGQGITHFSEVYAAPIAPVIRSVNNEDIPGANTFDGAVTSQIVLPSYQVMGSSVAPQLIYNSSWANPTALIKNIIDIPRNEVNIDDPINFKERGIRFSGNQTLSSWVEPEYIEAQFQTGSTITDKVTFTGMPNKSLISYGVDLSTENSGAFPYLAQYWIKIKNTVISTLNINGKSGLGSRTSINRSRVEEFRKIYPQNIGGNLYINNLKNSSYGQGWDVAGVQKILKTDDVRLAIKEGNGQISSYVLDSSIDTIFEDLNGIQAINLNDPNESFYIDSQNNVKTWSLDSGNSTLIQSFGNFTGTYGEDFLEGRESCLYDNVGCHTDYFCVNQSSNYSIPRIFTSIAKIESDQLVFVDENGLVYKNESLIAGQTKTPSFNQKSAFCSSFNIDCGPSFAVGEYAAPVCFNLHASSGVVPEAGNINGDSSVSKLNRPFEVIKGIKANTLIFSDSGNHQIKELDLSTNSVSVVAGNGTSADAGDGGDAKNAGIRYPRGLSYDGNGNLYVVTGSGYVRRIDANGIITTFAGKPVAEGGELVNKTDANRMALVEPTYLAIDNDNQMMFVSDTANNRVVQIDMQNGGAQTFAGNGTCTDGLIGDKGNALEASLCSPGALGFDANKNLLVHDKGHKRIRRITLETSNLGTLVYKPSSKDQSVLYKNQDGTFERHYRNGSIDHFNINGQQVSSIARNGREVNYEYGPDGKLASMIDPSNSQISFNYSGNKLINITDPANRVTEFNYNGETLSSVTFPDGTSKLFFYDAKGLLISEQNERGNSTSYQYNIYNRLAKIVRPDLTEVEVTDAASGAAASSTLKSISSGELYDGIKDAKGFETKFISDTEGFVSTIIDAEGKETKIERNVFGDPTKIIRPDSSFATFTYDPITRDLLEKFDSLTNVSMNFSYDSYGNLTSSTDELGVVSTSTIDPVTGNLLRTQRLDQFVQFDYFDLGLVKTKTNNLNQFINYSYDQFGNLSKATDSLGIETIYLRDYAGNNTEVIDGKGQFTRYEYDLYNRLTKVISPKNEATNYSYLATGELSHILDPKNNETFFNYDPMGRLIQKIDPLNRTINLSYDSNGNIAREVDYIGNIKDFEYDSLNRLTKKILPDNLYEFTYDIRNNITQVKDSFSQVDLSYVPTEKGYQVESESLTGLGMASGYGSHTVDYTFNNSGNRDSMTSSAIGSTNYEYDNQKRLIGLVNHRNQNFNFEYDAASRVKKIITPVIESSMSFDSTNFLTSLVHTNNSGTVINSFEYVRDALGNRIQMRTPAGNFNYDYDQNSQLTNSQSPEVGVESFTYDPLGNRITDQNGNYIYDSKAQRLIEDYNHFYSFDDNGNLSSKVAKDLSKTENYIHDSQNRMVEFAVFEGSTKTREVKYFYDALGRRIRKVSNDLQDATSKITNFLYEGNEVIAKTDDSNQVLVSFTHSSLHTDDPLAMHVTTAGVQAGISQSSEDIFYVKDAQGSVIDLVDSNGDLIEHYSYGSFGNLIKITDLSDTNVSTNPNIEPYFTYTSREYESESGLYYYRARYYDSSVGQFIQTDPFRGVLSSPATFMNGYIYTRNNPINLDDPFGRFSPLSTLVDFASASIVYTALPLFAGYNSAEEANKNGGSAFQVAGIFVFNAVMVGLTTYVSGAVFGAVLTATAPVLGPLAVPAAIVAAAITTGALTTLQNAGNQAIMGRSVNWKRAAKAGSQAATFSAATFGIGAGFNLGQFSNAIINGVGGAAGAACADTGITPMSNEQVSEQSYFIPSECRIYIEN
ncbi:MAG: hypothetical protein COV37_19660 [Bdellovibrio sp. CG11_big_fil_rev_8_21_14_0_20_39_38]|nr:MAG: hypothetical protein COV37_19660 [Bdellovibrio sp. CG11_big_fil_rev_8_21_14_0_20_39_38]